jgi:hypothetical protein
VLHYKVTLLPMTTNSMADALPALQARQAVEDEHTAVDAAGLFTKENEGAEYGRLVAAGKVIAAYQPGSIQDAATLLACVFMDDAAENAHGLSIIEQLVVLENVKRFLRNYVEAEKAVTPHL